MMASGALEFGPSVHPREQTVTRSRRRPSASTNASDDRLDVEVALLLCHWFGDAVLS
jgi:hypothetical protein